MCPSSSLGWGICATLLDYLGRLSLAHSDTAVCSDMIDLAKSDTAKGLDRTSRGQLGPAGQAAGLSFSASHRGVVVPMAALQLEGAAPALFLSRAPGWWGAENLGLGGGHSL